MVPNQPLDPLAAAAAAKRKYAEDSQVLAAPKKPKTDIDLRTKQKVGGLVITRGPPSRAPSAQPAAPQPKTTHNAPARAASEASLPVAGPSHPRKPPSATANGAHVHHQQHGRGARKKAKELESVQEMEGDGEVEEAVRRMNSEADDLRDRTRANIATMTPKAKAVELELPPTTAGLNGGGNAKGRGRQGMGGRRGGMLDPETPTRGGREGTMPVNERETPQIAKNRMMRGEQRIPGALGLGGGGEEDDAMDGRPQSLTRRRSSFSSRGKRSTSSFESTGIITLPHTSVKDASLFKHIDPDLPEAQRMRQLLVWVASRASDSSASKGKSNKHEPDPNLPPLPPGGDELLKEIEDDIIRLIAEGKVDTNVYSDPSSPKKTMKENEQNVKNRAREQLFSEQIEERRKEDVAWAEVAQFYNAYQANILTTLSQEKSASAKAKGKQRATSQEPDLLEPWENELPEEFRGGNGYDVAKHLLEIGLKGVRDKDPRFDDLEYQEDRLHATLTVADELTKAITLALDDRFSILADTLAQRTLPPPPGAPQPGAPPDPTKPRSLAAFVPPSSSSASAPSASSSATLRRTGPDPRDLLRALSRVETLNGRPRGDAARRAAKDVARVQEAQRLPASSSDGGGGVGGAGGGTGGSSLAVLHHAGERRLVGVPPATPRKPPPGTPKRPTTPGTGRR